MTLNLIGKNPANGSAVIAFYNKKVVLHLRSKKKIFFILITGVYLEAQNIQMSYIRKQL